MTHEWFLAAVKFVKSKTELPSKPAASAHAIQYINLLDQNNSAAVVTSLVIQTRIAEETIHRELNCFLRNSRLNCFLRKNNSQRIVSTKSCNRVFSWVLDYFAGEGVKAVSDNARGFA